MPHFPSGAEIDCLGPALVACSLPKAEWTHAGHFAAACWLLRQRGAQALRDMPELIRRYNEATGVHNTDSSGYHETITLASLRAARAWLAERQDVPLHEALEELLASRYGRADWLLDYWSRPLLFSPAARRIWVEPDLQVLPF